MPNESPVSAPSDSSSPLRVLQRDRLLAAIALMLGVGLMLALPFAFQAGAPFFLPVTAALVIAIALVPLLEWFERRGLPSAIASAMCLLIFLVVANVAIAAIIVPATDWLALLPERIDRVRTNIGPLLEVYSALERFINDTVAAVARTSASPVARVTVEQPNSLLDLVTTSAPAALIQMFFVVLVVFFFLAGWTRMRRRTLTVRQSFSSALTTSRVIQQMVHDTSAYLAMITAINLGLGVLVAAALWLIDMPSPVMWGGLVAILNYIPYLGPIGATLLLALGGLMTFTDPLYALLPALIFVGIHLVEANLLTPMMVGRRLTINPLLILIALSYWGWVWGTAGALLAVPLLIIFKTVIDAAGKPDIAGFLFGHGTLSSDATDPVEAGDGPA